MGAREGTGSTNLLITEQWGWGLGMRDGNSLTTHYGGEGEGIGHEGWPLMLLWVFHSFMPHNRVCEPFRHMQPL